MSRVTRIDDALVGDMRAWRRHLHAHPEVGFEEHQTTAFVRGLLDEWGLTYSTPLATGTVVHVRGEQPGPVLVVRADIDALPIQEENDLAFASTTPGVMHACGHDGHTAILLGLARLLSQQADEVRGEIRLLFQPAEELVDGGAAPLIEAGVLDGASAVVGLHLRSDQRSGTIGLSHGAVMASDDRFDVTVVGAGGHAGSPHQTTDALVVAAGLVGELQRVVSRRVDPLDPVAVTVGTFDAGVAYNIVPGEARLSGTVRTLSPEARDRVESELVGLARGYAAAHGATAEVTYRRGSPPLLNHPDAVELVRPAAEAVVGVEGVTAPLPRMGAEDFAFYGEHLPSVYVNVGAGGPDPDSAAPHHHPHFDLDEDALVTGVQFFAEVATRWSAGKVI